MKINNLIRKSADIRLSILDTLQSVGKGHIGGAFSCVEILVALYYSGVLKYTVLNPKWKQRDRFILSKGHAAVALYTILADLRFFDPIELEGLNDCGLLGEHPDMYIPGVEVNSGSLGHGLGIGAGIAYAAKLDGNDFNTYVLLGDGECYEGSIWEAAMFAAHHKLTNLTAIVDRNYLCIHGNTEEINKLDPLIEKFHSFGWSCDVIDGHDFDQLITALNYITVKPKVIIANTIKGKGVSFMENIAGWHHGGISKEVYKKAREELLNDRYA